MTGGRLDFAFQFGTGEAPEADAGDERLSILVLADLAGNRERELSLAARTPVSIDVDNAERVLARFAPALSLAVADPDGGARRVELTFASLDDFHPDNLFRHSAAFADLRGLREELGDPASFARAAAALGLAAGAVPATAGIPAESDSDMLTRLLGRAPEPAQPASPGLVDRLVREAVADHVVPDAPLGRDEAYAHLDRLIAGRMRAILHHPDFQRLEAAWRGVWKLATELDTDNAVRLAVLDLRRAELAADLAVPAGDLSGTAMARLLGGAGAALDEGARWSLLVADFGFGPEVTDVALLAALGTLAGRVGAPLLGGADARVLGVADLADLAPAAQWQPASAPALAAWQALRRSPAAGWLGLALPRVLVRLPYGAGGEAVEAFAFEELADGSGHAGYLWGNPAYALAWLVGQGWGEEGAGMDVSARLNVTDLPSHVVRDADGEPRQQACAEFYLSDSAAEAILARGVMPLISFRGRNYARLLRWQSLADPARGLPGVLAG
ncbi:hypothetical protein EZJ19_00500 [Parasulfuritortus cantonensis]|uniref:TssC1 N-terminal domain-containing protein n=1 Tax=Parasulfuritortus cantonensis TaxID=2528202 RepID=A0A4R1BRK3_9PROT|nr:type VI secretion system contractile sheath large subunit [Parasulfuritortus cantonensis]TCJ20409.1 hypothetical protein EZJ19_00500 [Parasulfuritortus cantonensis]